MQFTKNQIILGVAGGLALILILLVLFGVLPGRRSGSPTTEIVVWGTDDARIWQRNAIANFKTSNPTINVRYKRFNEENYENELVNALARGERPDVVFFHSSWLLKHGDKISPAPTDKISPAVLQSLFPRVVEQDFAANERVYALPLFIDTLAMVYNRDIFDRSEVVFPPSTWEELAGVVSSLRVLDNGSLQRGAFALGGVSRNTPNAIDIVTAMLLQSGVVMTNARVDMATFATERGRSAFGAYMRFSDPSSVFYSWNNEMREGKEAFARGEVAGVFLYSSERNNIKARNAFLNIGTAPLPQFDTSTAVNTADYWGLAVPRSSLNQNEAWDFALFVATDINNSRAYMNMTQRPPALRVLINEKIGDSDIGVFAEQSLTARSWLQPGKEAVRGVFDEAIGLVLSGELTSNQGAQRAQSLLTELLRQR